MILKLDQFSNGHSVTDPKSVWSLNVSRFRVPVFLVGTRDSSGTYITTFSFFTRYHKTSFSLSFAW
jgi:hypothetical protein